MTKIFICLLIVLIISFESINCDEIEAYDESNSNNDETEETAENKVTDLIENLTTEHSNDDETNNSKDEDEKDEKDPATTESNLNKETTINKNEAHDATTNDENHTTNESTIQTENPLSDEKTIKTSSSPNESYLESLVTTFSDCNIILQIGVGINVHFFADQFSLTIIDPSEESAANAFKCASNNLFRPISIFDDILQIDLGDETDSSSVSSYSLNNGLYVKSGHDDALGILKIIASHNPRAKVLIHITDGEIEDAQGILKSAFDDLKMLNLAIVSFGETETESLSIFLILYNPFCGDKDNRQPEYLNLKFNPLNIAENFDKMKEFTEKRISNLYQYPLRVNIFDFPMVSKPVYDDNNQITRYSYVDGETIQIIGEKLNFTLLYVEAMDGEQYGFQLEDGNFTGSLGLIENEQVDLLGNPRLIANYNTTRSLFLQPITMMRLSFIIKRRLTFKLLVLFYYSQYDNISTILGSICTAAFPLIYAFVNKCERKIVNRHVTKERRIKSSSVIRNVLYTFAISNNVSMQHSNGRATRIVVSVVLFYTLVVSSLYQSSITKNLNTNQVIGKISSIDGLLEQNFMIAMSPDITAIFRDKNSQNKVSALMRNSKLSIEQVKLSHKYFKDTLINDDKFAYLWSDLYVENYLDQFYDESTGENQFENVPEIAYEFYISLMAPKSSPFIEKFNEILVRFVETGIMDYHTRRAKADNDMFWIQRTGSGHTPKEDNKAIKYIELVPLFKIYLYLIAASFIIFLLECLIWKPKKAIHHKRYRRWM